MRGNSEWVLPRVKTVNRGIETIRYRGPMTWELVPEEIKKCKSLNLFKEKIKKWKLPGCTCRLCKSYVPGFGYCKISENLNSVYY